MFRENVVVVVLNDVAQPDQAGPLHGRDDAQLVHAHDGDGGLPPCPAPEVVFYETTLGTAPVARFIPSLFVDISTAFDRKCEALDLFAAQPGLAERYGWLARYRALEAQSTAWMKGCDYAEGFVRLGTETAGFAGPGGFGA